MLDNKVPNLLGYNGSTFNLAPFLLLDEILRKNLIKSPNFFPVIWWRGHNGVGLVPPIIPVIFFLGDFSSFCENIWKKEYSARNSLI
jgi:hypothetical protein